MEIAAIGCILSKLYDLFNHRPNGPQWLGFILTVPWGPVISGHVGHAFRATLNTTLEVTISALESGHSEAISSGN